MRAETRGDVSGSLVCSPFFSSAVGDVFFVSTLQFKPAGEQLSRTKQHFPAEGRYHQLAEAPSEGRARRGREELLPLADDLHRRQR